MKVLEWSMTIPIDKQKGFLKWFKETAGPTFQRFGAIKHEIHKVQEEELVGRQKVEKDRFIERVYFDKDFELSKYFENVGRDPTATELSKMYEEKFKASNIQLRVLVAA